MSDFYKNYFQQQYQYFIDQGYLVYIKHNDHPVIDYKYTPSISTRYYLCPQLEQKKFEEQYQDHFMFKVPQEKYVKPYQFEDPIVFSNKNSSIGLDSMINFYNSCTDPTYKEQILDLIPYCSGNLNKNYLHFFNQINGDNKDLITVIKKIPIYHLEANTLCLDILNDFLEKKQISPQDIDTFFLSFLKKRKKQLQNPVIGLDVKNFLLKKYFNNMPQLTLYFPFFPNLKNEFEISNIDIFNTSYPYDIYLEVSIDSMKNKFFIPKWNSFDYFVAIHEFTNGVKEHFQLEKASYQEKVNNSDIICIVYEHTNEQFNKPLLKNIFLEFFNFLKIEPDFNIQAKNISHWINYNTLQNTLVINNNHKKKILKKI